MCPTTTAENKMQRENTKNSRGEGHLQRTTSTLTAGFSTMEARDNGTTPTLKELRENKHQREFYSQKADKHKTYSVKLKLRHFTSQLGRLG